MRIASAILVVAAVLLATGCGAGSRASTPVPVTFVPTSPPTSPPPAPKITLVILPQNLVLGVGETRTFSADMTATWSVQEGPAGGTITSAGAYTAPAVAGTYHVVAHDAADASDTATATVTVVTSGFTFSGNLNTARLGHTATLLPNGEVLVVGGINSFDVEDGFSLIDQAETYDPSTGNFALAGRELRLFHTATLLLTGKILLAGGETDSSGNASATADLYDPLTGTFQSTGSMAVARQSHAATLLNDGRVLLTGGFSPQGMLSVLLSTADVYDPATGVFAPAGNMSVARADHTATLLPGGKVLITGGSQINGAEVASAELYDPATGSFAVTGSMLAARRGHTATLLADGRVLVVGGQVNGAQTAELYDPLTGSFTATGSLATPRIAHTATLLPNNTVLIAGGVTRLGGSDLATASAELYDVATGLFTLTGSMEAPRNMHTGTLLPDGTVLIVGGATDVVALRTSEIYK